MIKKLTENNGKFNLQTTKWMNSDKCNGQIILRIQKKKEAHLILLFRIIVESVY